MSRFQEWKGLVSGRPEYVAAWNAQMDKAENDERSWVDWLRAGGIKAAHPDDGWVDRKMNTVQFAYPAFDDGVNIGDRIVLGWPESFRVVTVRGIEKTIFGAKKYVWSYDRPRR